MRRLIALAGGRTPLVILAAVLTLLAIAVPAALMSRDRDAGQEGAGSPQDGSLGSSEPPPAGFGPGVPGVPASTPPGTGADAPPTEAEGPDCTLRDLKAVVSTNRDSYGPNDNIEVRFTVTNSSRRACVVRYPNMQGEPQRYAIEDGAGSTVFFGDGFTDCGFAGSSETKAREELWPPGHTFNALFTWSRLSCTEGKRVPPGDYRISAEFYGFGQVSDDPATKVVSPKVSFEIRG